MSRRRERIETVGFVVALCSQGLALVALVIFIAMKVGGAS